MGSSWSAAVSKIVQNWREHPPFSSSAAVSKIVENWREHPPSSYSLKLHNFSQLENSTSFSDDKYQSRLFSSGGYNWRLIVYPKGNKKDNGSGFISMYVEIDDKGTEVFTELRFFVYNKKENKYFTIQDVEVKRFNALKTVWGLRHVLPYDTFSNPNNGYIFEGDQCEFGVDVIVAPPLTNWEILSFNEKLPHPKFSWTVKNFSTLKEEFYKSDSFPMGGSKWVIQLHPKGNIRQDGKWLSLFLCSADGDRPKIDENKFRQARVRVLDPLGSNHFARRTNRWHNESNLGWGWDQFMSLAQLRKSYLDDEGTLKVEIEFEVVSATKYSPIGIISSANNKKHKNGVTSLSGSEDKNRMGQMACRPKHVQLSEPSREQRSSAAAPVKDKYSLKTEKAAGKLTKICAEEQLTTHNRYDVLASLSE